ncbi:MAG TPA: hypothetical protein VNJ01_16920 [Bacteriovoracaceae bacterium]|nr:hypothetical protein [Bacteriovoracaceae bacterium]
MIRLLALMIAITSTVYKRQGTDLSFDQMETLSQLPVFDLPLSRAVESKPSSKQNLVVLAFNPLALQADVSYQVHEHQHDYYLPLYRLHRQKEYFLLI